MDMGDPILKKNESAILILKAIVDVWYRACPPSTTLLENLEPDLRDSLSFLLEDMQEVLEFTSQMAKGKMNTDLKARGRMAQELKGLHTDLRHLAWQARKVAEGDLGQSISFMGEFSDAFNRIVGDLAEYRATQTKELAEARMATIFAMAKLSEARDEDTGLHLERTRTFCEILAKGLSHDMRFRKIIDESFIESLRNASPLHDIGKVAIPDRILLKHGPLDDEEILVMKEHPRLGAETLMAVRSSYPHNTFIDMGIAIARSHHERWDGKGYPDGLGGLDIPLPARIMAVSDVYDALRARRCYKNPLSHDESIKIIEKSSGQQFDPGIVEVFNKYSHEFESVWMELQD